LSARPRVGLLSPSPLNRRWSLAGFPLVAATVCGLIGLVLGCAGSGSGTPPTTGVPSTITTTSEVTPSTADPLALMDEAVRDLDWGSIVFNAPNTIRYGQVQTVELVLSRSLPVSALQDQLEQQSSVESAMVRISNRMEARLTGIGFTIEALGPDLQAVTNQQVTRWQWEVTPTGSGLKTLHLSLSAYVGVAGSDAPLVVRTYDRDINVDVTVGQRVTSFLRGNWTWLWVAVVVPCAGYFWAVWRRRRSRALAAPPDGDSTGS
jgi:hypothetical protein